MISEETWLQVDDPRALLTPERITLRFNGRKLRLLSLALAREVRHLIHAEELLAGFDLAEYVADLPEDHEEEDPVLDLMALRRFRNNGPRPDEQACMAFCEAIGPPDEDANPYDYLDPYRCKNQPAKTAMLAAMSVASAVAGAAPRDPMRRIDWQRTFDRELRNANIRSASLSRCVLGNPFRQSPILDPGWITSGVVELASSIYHSRDFRLLPILADELEDAGCDDSEILNHARYTEVHARGCWVLDVILDK